MHSTHSIYQPLVPIFDVIGLFNARNSSNEILSNATQRTQRTQQDTMIALGEACLEAEEKRQRRHGAAMRPHRLDLGGAQPANESERSAKQRHMRDRQHAESERRMRTGTDSHPTTLDDADRVESGSISQGGYAQGGYAQGYDARRSSETTSTAGGYGQQQQPAYAGAGAGRESPMMGVGLGVPPHLERLASGEQSLYGLSEDQYQQQQQQQQQQGNYQQGGYMPPPAGGYGGGMGLPNGPNGPTDPADTTTDLTQTRSRWGPGRTARHRWPRPTPPGGRRGAWAGRSRAAAAPTAPSGRRTAHLVASAPTVGAPSTARLRGVLRRW